MESSSKITMLYLAQEVLRNKGASQTAKRLAACVLSQNKENTGEVKDLASKILSSEKYAKITKKLAGSALSKYEIK